MKLLAVVAIGVIVLLGSPTTGAAKSELEPEVCEVILDAAKMSWQHFTRYLNSEWTCLLYTSPSPRDATLSRMPSSA